GSTALAPGGSPGVWQATNLPGICPRVNGWPILWHRKHFVTGSIPRHTQPGRSMSRKKAPRTPTNLPTALDQARDELFSHILRCGVLEAAVEHQTEWMDDTMQYLGDRYPDLTPEELGKVRVLGERFCQPVVKR